MANIEGPVSNENIANYIRQTEILLTIRAQPSCYFAYLSKKEMVAGGTSYTQPSGTNFEEMSQYVVIHPRNRFDVYIQALVSRRKILGAF